MEVDQILTSLETRDSSSCVRTMLCVYLITLVIEVIMSIATRNTRRTFEIVTLDRDQILRFDVTGTTIYPSRINDE